MARELIDEGPVPMYQQLENILREKIESGEYSSGSAIPTEQELIDQYQVSRTTVRQALKRLAQENMIVKVRGKGTYVDYPEITQDLVTLRTINEVLTSAGLVPKVEVLGIETDPQVPAHVLTKLRVEPGERILRVKRRHLVEGEPVVYAVIYLSGKHNWHFSAEDLTQHSIYSWLEEKDEVIVDSGYQVIKAMAATTSVAEALHLETGDPVLHLENTSYTQSGVPIEHSELYFLPQRYSFTITLRRTRAGISLENFEAGLAQPGSRVD